MMPEAPAVTYRWYHKVGAFLFITVCMLVGLFLLIFPWTDYWGGNFFSGLFPRMEVLWDNMFVRGGVSGLGLANLYISFIELFRLERFVKS
jgi:hypothetical protein